MARAWRNRQVAFGFASVLLNGRKNCLICLKDGGIDPELPGRSMKIVKYNRVAHCRQAIDA
jgi:hypothetical protein